MGYTLAIGRNRGVRETEANIIGSIIKIMEDGCGKKRPVVGSREKLVSVYFPTLLIQTFGPQPLPQCTHDGTKLHVVGSVIGPGCKVSIGGGGGIIILETVP